MSNLIEQFKKNIGNVLYKDRFNLIEIDNLIDDNLFKELRNNFPDEKFFSKHNDFAMSFPDDNENFNRFIADNKNWQKLIKQFQSKDFVEYLMKFFRINNVYYRNSWKKFIPYFKESKLNFCFNISKNGGFSLPHTDSSRKLISLVFFFVDDDWSKNDGGFVNLYEPIDKKFEYNWRNERVDPKNLTVINSIFPKKNKIYGFKKTKNSYHSVEKVVSKNLSLRKVLMINLVYANKSDSPYKEKKFLFF